MDRIDRRLLERLQAGLPLLPRPFAAMAEALGLSERAVLARVRALHDAGLIRRIGPVIDPARAGRLSTLAAMAVPEERLEAVAATISACEDVSHNYERVARHGSCPFNLWFTLSAASQAALDGTIAGLARATGLPITVLAARRRFKIGVRFALDKDDGDG